jgi:hypothetical protein
MQAGRVTLIDLDPEHGATYTRVIVRCDQLDR